MIMPTPAGKPLPLTARATLAHYTAQARIAELEAEVALLKVDAERYRWLRDDAPRRCITFLPYGTAAEIDAAIDAALAASKVAT